MLHQVQLSSFMIDFELEMMNATLNNVWHENPKKYQFPALSSINRLNQAPKAKKKDSQSIRSRESSSKFTVSQRSSLSPMYRKSNFYHSQRNLKLKLSLLNISEQKQNQAEIQVVQQPSMIKRESKKLKRREEERNQDTPSIKINVHYSYDGIF